MGAVISAILGADRHVRRFGMQTVDLGDIGCRPSNSTLMQTDDFGDLWCRLSNSMLLHADHHFRLLFLQTAQFDDSGCT